MYEERKNSLSVRDIILQVLLLVLFVFIMVWLFPTKNFLKDKNVIDNDQLYTNYITNMAEAAKDYFTIERMPSKVGDSVKLTLNEMLNNKLLLEIGGNASCDLEKSYVEITKMDTDYQLRVELSCEDYSNYVYVIIGCTDVCTDCNNVVENKPVTKPTTKPTTTPSKPKEEEEVKPVVQVTKYTVTFDSNGGSPISSQTVEEGKLATKPTNPTRNGYTFTGWTLNGKAYDFKTPVTSNITLVANWTKNVVTLYQYSKPVYTSSTSYTDWSDWSTETLVLHGTTSQSAAQLSNQLVNKNTDTKEYKVVTSGYTTVGTKEVCSSSSSVETVVVDSLIPVKNMITGKVNVTSSKYYVWESAGQIESDEPLATYYKDGEISDSENADTKYEFVEIKTVSPEGACVKCTEYTVWVYEKTVLVEKTLNEYTCEEGYTKTGSGSSTKCTKYENTCSTYGEDYVLEGTQCVKYGEQEIETDTCKDVPVRKPYVKYQVRTRELKNENNVSSYEYVWSTSSNDEELIKKGYTYTGTTKSE